MEPAKRRFQTVQAHRLGWRLPDDWTPTSQIRAALAQFDHTDLIRLINGGDKPGYFTNPPTQARGYAAEALWEYIANGYLYELADYERATVCYTKCASHLHQHLDHLRRQEAGATAPAIRDGPATASAATRYRNGGMGQLVS